MQLVIVESPAKSKTIEKYLGKDFKVVASMGHIRNLANKGKYGLGIDVENGFKPTFEVISGKSKVLKELKKLVSEADNVYLASDPDREGEAISWHLKEYLKLKKYHRIEFNEITKDVVLNAIDNPRDIDMDLVKSQETRQMLDKIIGYRLSQTLRGKTSGSSAGRVQSVALKLIVDREREIDAFIAEEYWTIEAEFKDFTATLEKYKDKKIEIGSETEADSIISKLDDKYVVESVEEKESKVNSKPVFKTSTLQQLAGNKLNFSAKKTMKLAQELYEGIDIGQDTVGLITYMRTDSERMSPVFINDAFNYIETKYGKEYVGFVRKQKENENMQDAHEGIRPTSVNRTPESIKKYLSNDQYKLYNLIYKRAVASLMAPSIRLTDTIILDNNDYKFKATGSIITFDGYLKLYDLEEKDENKLPKLENKDELKAKSVEKKQHFTEPKPRYTEASLIKEMESLGIGRPSTYATIVTTIKERGYVELIEKKFKPTTVGFTVNDFLQKWFDEIINTEYTAEMEKDLDKIADEKKDWVETLERFYTLLEKLIGKVEIEVEVHPEETCPKCNKPLVKRYGKYGEFWACPNYPECEYILSIEEKNENGEEEPKEELNRMCPKCGNPLEYKKGPYGDFIGCSNYPKCKYTESNQIEIMDCPKCHEGKIIERRSRKGKVFYGCNRFPKCKTAYWDKPIERKCPKCGDVLLEQKDKIKCSKCEYEEGK